jgi:hypothetical protein
MFFFLSDPTVRHIAYEYVARTMKEDQLEQGWKKTLYMYLYKKLYVTIY